MLFGVITVARWSDVEANGHGAVKDIDVLLRTDKSSIPKQDAWYISAAFLLVIETHF